MREHVVEMTSLAFGLGEFWVGGIADGGHFFDLHHVKTLFRKCSQIMILVLRLINLHLENTLLFLPQLHLLSQVAQ